MKKGWQLEAIGNLCVTATGTTPSTNNRKYYGDHIPFIKPPNLSNGYLCNPFDKLSIEGKKVARIAPKKSVLITCIGILGKSCLTETEVAFNQQINAIYPQENIIFPKFLLYQVQSPLFQKQLRLLSSGTTVEIVNKSRFNTIKVVVPPLEEQKRIISLLDEAFANLDRAQAHIEANLKNTTELFESYLQSLLQNGDGCFNQPNERGWQRKKLREVIKLNYGKGLPQEHRNPNGEFPVYGANGILAYSNSFLIKEKSLIIGRKGSAGEITLAKAPFWPTDVTYYTSYNSKEIKFNFMYYLLHFLNLPRLARGVKPGINREEVYALDINLPSLEEQQHIVSLLDQASSHCTNLEEKYKTNLQNIAELRQSLLQQALAGALT